MFFFRRGYSRLKGRGKASQDVALDVPMNTALELDIEWDPHSCPWGRHECLS